MSGRTGFVCPVCGQASPAADMLCSGSFLDRDHPANVPVVPEPDDERDPEREAMRAYEARGGRDPQGPPVP